MTQISAGPTNKGGPTNKEGPTNKVGPTNKEGPTNKNGPTNKGGPTIRLVEKVTTHHVQQESIAIQTQILVL
jgi:hypothetical protein